MGKGRKTGGRDFKPGESGNPKGRTPLPPEVRAFRRLTLTELQGHICDIAHLTRAELRDRINSKELPALQQWIYKMALDGAKNGSPFSFNTLMDRVVGRVADQVNITGKLTAEIKAKSDAELASEARALIAAMEGEKK